MKLKVYKFTYKGLFKYKNRRTGYKIMFEDEYYTCNPNEALILNQLGLKHEVLECDLGRKSKVKKEVKDA